MEVKYLYVESATGNDLIMVTRSWLRLSQRSGSSDSAKMENVPKAQKDKADEI